MSITSLTQVEDRGKQISVADKLVILTENRRFSCLIYRVCVSYVLIILLINYKIW